MIHPLIEATGIIGGALFAIGCVPMAVRTWMAGRTLGTPIETQWLLFLGCVLYSIYLFGAFGIQIPFWFLVIEVVSWGVALRYYYWPRGM